jgi:hypothetical protein
MMSVLRGWEQPVMHSVTFPTSSMNTPNSNPSDTQPKSPSSRSRIQGSSHEPSRNGVPSQSSATSPTNGIFSHPIPRGQMTLYPPSAPCGDNSVPSIVCALAKSNLPAGQRRLVRLIRRRRGYSLVNLRLKGYGEWIIR